MKNFLFKNSRTGEVATVSEANSDQALLVLLREKQWPLSGVLYDGIDGGQGFDPRFVSLDNVKDISYNEFKWEGK